MILFSLKNDLTYTLIPGYSLNGHIMTQCMKESQPRQAMNGLIGLMVNWGSGEPEAMTVRAATRARLRAATPPPPARFPPATAMTF